MYQRLQIRFLGGFDIAFDGRRLNGFQSLRHQRFLARLILREGTQRRSHLAFEFWPDSGEAQARTNLRKLLHEVRLALPEGEVFIEIGHKHVRWREEASANVDVLRFRAAMQNGDFEEAAAAYAGDLLPACYDDWVLEARSALRTDALAAFARLMEAATVRDDPVAVLAHARHVLELEPTEETAICHQIEAHIALDDRNAAMRAYHRYADAMERELDVAPGEAVQALYQKVRSGFARPEDTKIPDAEPPIEPPAAGSPFVGRDTELALLLSAWAAAREGASHLVLVTGEPGIGKSRLSRELGRRVTASGHSVVTARAYEAAGRLPWGPVVDLLRSKDLQDRIETLDPVWRKELRQLLPELAAPDRPSAHDPSGDPTQRHRLFDAVRRALVSPDLPRLLILDDLQWCDRETIEMIGFMIHSEPAAPLLIIGTVRPEEVPEDHPLPRLTDALARDGAVTTLPLEPLDPGATATLAARMREVERVQPDFARRLWTETNGNPLFLVETLRASASSANPETVVTPTMRAVMGRRLGQLSEDARHLAEIAAVIGRAFSLELIAATTNTDEPALIDAIDELWQRRIIVEQGLRYDFSHDKLRDVALEMVSPVRRRLLHRAVASALIAVHGDESGAISPHLAAHYSRAGMPEPAIQAFRAAGANAASVSAFEEAVDHFSSALSLLAELPGSPARDRLELDIRIALGSPLVALEGYGAERAHRLYERAMALCRKLGDPVGAPILRGLGLARLQGCRFAECDALGAALVDKGANDPIAMTEGRYLLGVSAFWQGDLARSRTCLESALANYETPHRREHLARFAQDPKAVCLVRMALTELWQGDPGGSAETVRAAHALADDIGHLMTLGYVLTYASIAAAEAEDYDQLSRLLADGEELWKRFSMRYLSVVLESLQGWIDLRRGDRQGSGRITEAVERTRAEGETLHLTYMLLLLARAHAQLGDVTRAQEAVQEAVSLTARYGQFYLQSELRRFEGELAFATGATEAAQTALCDAILIAKGQSAGWPELKARVSLVRLFPGDQATVDLRALTERIPSGHDLPAFRAAVEVLERSG